jgi:hypothetical protein
LAIDFFNSHRNFRQNFDWVMDFFVVDPITGFFTPMIFVYRGKVTRGEKIPLLLLPHLSKILQPV